MPTEADATCGNCNESFRWAPGLACPNCGAVLREAENGEVAWVLPELAPEGSLPQPENGRVGGSERGIW